GRRDAGELQGGRGEREPVRGERMRRGGGRGGARGGARAGARVPVRAVRAVGGEHGDGGCDRREDDQPGADPAPPAAPFGRLLAAQAALARGHEGGGAHCGGGLRSAPTMPTASMTRMKIEIPVATVTPCSIAA